MADGMGGRTPPRILIYAPHARGGLAEHVFYQSRALAKAGAEVRCLVSPSYLGGRTGGGERRAALLDPVGSAGRGLGKRAAQLGVLLGNPWRLAVEAFRWRPDLVLMDSYVEYMSPLWIWPHIILAKACGVRYAANLHDPVRAFRLGPRWWHRWSVRLAYAPLSAVFVHDDLPAEARVPERVAAFKVPVGMYDVREGGGGDRHAWRLRHGIPEGSTVFLAFGHVRDGKNLQFVIDALAAWPAAVFVMAGVVQAGGERGFDFYRCRAQERGVGDRCRFIEGFVPDEEVAGMFAAADVVVLTYSSAFRSQSGVLNIAARCRKPVLVSGGACPLVRVTREFGLGIAVEPDSAAEVRRGMGLLLQEPVVPQWEAYERYASWDANAAIVIQAVGGKA